MSILLSYVWLIDPISWSRSVCIILYDFLKVEAPAKFKFEILLFAKGDIEVSSLVSSSFWFSLSFFYC